MKISKERFFSSSVMLLLTFFAVINDWIFVTVILVLTIGGLYEFFYMIKKKGIPIYSYVGIFLGTLIPLSILTEFVPTKNWELLFIVLAFLLILLLQFGRNDNSNAIVGISTTLFGVFFVAWSFSFLIKIRMLLPDIGGVKLLAFLLLVIKSGDIGALVIGSWKGRHPLLPKVSPNKSVEGCLGGFVFSIIAALLARPLLPEIPPLFPEIPHFSILHVAAMGAFFGGIGQLGDLSESIMKRDCGVKDSGKLLPGMGGVLDVIDSLLFAAPTFYLYMSATLNLI